MNVELLYRRARAAVFLALVGGETGSDFGLAGRTALTLLVFALATIIWAVARAEGVIGSGAFYFPAILVASLFAGWQFGFGILVACSVLVIGTARTQFPASSFLVFGLAGGLQIVLAGLVHALLGDSWRAERHSRTLVEQHEREADAREMVLGEARHRLKNLFAIIEALAKYSGPKAGRDPAIDGFMQNFMGRLRALGAASDLVLKQRLSTVGARALIGAVLEPFLSEEPARLDFDGPEIELSEHFGGSLALGVHELATNALKYGALSVPQGTVKFSWSVTPTDDHERVVFVWTESGGPVPSPPPRDGFGHRLLRSIAQREIEGEVVIDYPPEGLFCRISYLRRAAA